MTTPAGHANRVFEKSTSTGTGNLLLNGAENGFYSFFASFGTGVTLGYVAENPITGENEVGIGEVIDNGGGSYSLQRNSVETSSNANALVNFAAGFKYVRATFLASEGAILGAGSTGTGLYVRQTSPTINTPTLTAPVLGAASATTVNKVTITAPATSATLTLAQGSTLATSGANSITLTSSGATNVTLPTTGTLGTLAGSETLTNKTLTSPAINTPTITGSGGTLTLPAGPDTLVGRATTDTLTNKTLTSPTLVTPALGVATATSVNKITITAPATGATLTLFDGSTLATSGAFSMTLTATALTNVTLPTTGTLSTLAGSETLTNKTLTSPAINAPTITGSGGTLTLPAGPDTLIGRATTDTLTNKSIDASQLTGSVAAARMPALTGDVTTSAGAVATTIANNAVTFAKFQQIAASTLVGNSTGSLANASVITLGSSLRFSSGLDTIQDIRTSANPTWNNVNASGFNKVAITAPAASATLTLANLSTLATSGAFSITLTSTATTNVTLPTTGTLSTLAGSETLANKTLTSPTLTTPTLGVASATTINKVTITTPATGSTLTIADGKTLTCSNTVTLTATDGSTLAIGGGGTLAALAYLASVDCSGSQVTGVLAAARFPALTGDVTTSSGALATTIASNAVTYAKFQQVAASSLVGNATGSLANATGITLGTSMQFSGSSLNTIQGLRTTDSPTFAGASFTSATISGPTITGGSGSGQGGYFLWQRTGAVNPFFLGHRSAIAGGTSGNALLYSTGDNIEFAPAATATVLLTTTASTFATQILSSYASAGSGYVTGAGGSVTQATSRTTGVTLSKPCGQITTNTTSLAAGATAKFTVTNTLVASTDHVDVSIQSGTTTDATRVRVQSVGSGSFTIVVENGHASTAETGAIVVNFAVTKVVTS